MSRAILTAKEPTTEEFKIAVDSRNNKLIFTTFRNVPVMLLIKNNRLVCMKSLEETLVGGIYVARVDKISPKKDSCFVRIDKKQSCFLPYGNNFAPMLLNRNFDGTLKEGDSILVSVIRDGLKTKLPTVTAQYDTFMTSTMDLESIKHKSLYSVIKTPDSALQRIYSTFVSDQEYNEVITDSEKLYLECKDYFEAKDKNVRLYKDEAFSLSALYSLQTKCVEALSKKVWLKSGAYLVIEQTEACVVIDINSGKNIKKDAPSEIAYEINCEAMDEIALQLRLRELSGMILVDCINMPLKEQEKDLISYMQDQLDDSPIPVKVHDITRLGIMEITRKKMGKSLIEQFAN